MVSFVCESCGSSEFHEEDGYRICNHCGTKYIITEEDKRVIQSNIDLREDVARLLEKARSDPARARKYAQRVLEIDQNNVEAKLILMSSISSQKQSKSSGGCYVATAVYGSYDCPEVWTLRRYRDDVLGRTWYGRLFIYVYYAVSPTLVKWFGDTVWFSAMWKPKLDHMVCKLNRAGISNTYYVDKDW